MHYSQLKESKYLKQDDCGSGILVTISQLTQENMAKEGEPEDLKYVLHFEETEKLLSINSTNGQIIASITGEDDTDNWVGHKIVLYKDPNVQFKGKLVGGIRVRAPKNKAAAAAHTHSKLGKPLQKAPPNIPQDEPEAGEEDDVPF